MKKVSIIVPVYNTEKYLDKCLKSLVNQTLEEIEIIVINDGSTDGSLNIIKKYAKNYKDKIIYKSIKNSGGPGKPRNIGIKMAGGEYIGFVDSDDWAEPNMFERLYYHAKFNKLDIAECLYKYSVTPFKFRLPQWKFNYGNIKSNPELFIYIGTYPWNKLYKKEILCGINFPEKLFYEDMIFVSNTILKAKKIGQLGEPLYNYRFRTNSIMISSIRLKPIIVDVITILEILKKSFDDKEFKRYSNEIEGFAIHQILYRAAFIVMSFKIFENKKKILINLFLNYLDIYFPNWQKNKYYLKNFAYDGIFDNLLSSVKNYYDQGLRPYKTAEEIIQKIKELLI